MSVQTLYFYGIESTRSEGTDSFSANLGHIAVQGAGGGELTFYDASGKKVGHSKSSHQYGDVAGGSTRTVYFDAQNNELGYSVSAFRVNYANRNREYGETHFYNLEKELIGSFKNNKFLNIDGTEVGSFSNGYSSFTTSARDNFEYTEKQLAAHRKEKEDKKLYIEDTIKDNLAGQASLAKTIVLQFDREKKSGQEQEHLLELGDLKRKAENGSVRAQMMMGLCHYHGMKGCKIDGNDETGWRYWFGLVKRTKGNEYLKSFIEGLEALKEHYSKRDMDYFKQGMEENYVPAMYEGAFLIGYTQKGVELSKHLVALAYPPALCTVGKDYVWRLWIGSERADKNNTKNLDIGIKYLKQGAASGHAESRSALGECYAHGWGVPKDISKARELYTLALEQGYHHSATLIGELPSSSCCVIL